MLDALSFALSIDFFIYSACFVRSLSKMLSYKLSIVLHVLLGQTLAGKVRSIAEKYFLLGARFEGYLFVCES